MVFISVNTPTKNKGLGAESKRFILVEECKTGAIAQGHTIVVEKAPSCKNYETIKSISNHL